MSDSDITLYTYTVSNEAETAYFSKTIKYISVH